MKKLLLLIIATSFSLSLATTAEEKAQKLEQKQVQIEVLRKFEEIIKLCTEYSRINDNSEKSLEYYFNQLEKYKDCTTSWHSAGTALIRDAFKYARATEIEFNKKNPSSHHTDYGFNQLARKNLEERLACASITDPKERALKYQELTTIPGTNANAK